MLKADLLNRLIHFSLNFLNQHIECNSNKKRNSPVQWPIELMINENLMNSNLFFKNTQNISIQLSIILN